MGVKKATLHVTQANDWGLAREMCIIAVAPVETERGGVQRR
jgi:hypothetical protein